MCFVGVNQQPLSAEELIKLLQKFSTPPSYYFLRWAHRVGGFWRLGAEDSEYTSLEADVRARLQKNLDETFPSPQGQLFNSILEVRWQQKQGKYEVLLLSSQDKAPIFQLQNKQYSFRPIKRNWEIIEQNVLLHSPTETRFPKDLNSEDIKNIAQRYFRDKHTATVHFVALTIKK
ncbi:hypothetical protein [Nostoc sp. UHCC 0870]|uniref:hypothetical protein n=1 Tax=Nostoc sp. UHCC 0870 TaxID=2914041 RepID=UPI001EDF8C29|nr:hypothetical protein [Nostoc sp. UHCC 0870]UKP00944.1 hypothetical protein L6494_27685 [Nostoc sp. UHCC 0870]